MVQYIDSYVSNWERNTPTPKTAKKKTHDNVYLRTQKDIQRNYAIEYQVVYNTYTIVANKGAISMILSSHTAILCCIFKKKENWSKKLV